MSESSRSPDKWESLAERLTVFADRLKRNGFSPGLPGDEPLLRDAIEELARLLSARSHALQIDWSKPENTAAAAHMPNGQINVLAPGQRKTGEIAGYRNDDAPLARDVQTRPTSQERVSNPVEDSTSAPSTTRHKRLEELYGLLRDGLGQTFPSIDDSSRDVMWAYLDELYAATSGRDEIIEECARKAYHARLDGAPVEYAIRMLKKFPSPVSAMRRSGDRRLGSEERRVKERRAQVAKSYGGNRRYNRRDPRITDRRNNSPDGGKA